MSAGRMIKQKVQLLLKSILGKMGETLTVSPKLHPPYDYVQVVTEQYIHDYVGLKPEEIKHWCIVGGFLGSEALGILNNYPKSNVTIFECSQRYLSDLTNHYRDNERVEIVHKAVSNSKGTFTFYENSLDGIGSLLKPGKFLEENYGTNPAESYEVETITLDEYFAGKAIDLLQIDVQGAEKLVLEGAVEVLKNTKACFIEISIHRDLYKGAVTLDELYNFFKENGFHLALLGTDFNLTGNALFINAKHAKNVKSLW